MYFQDPPGISHVIQSESKAISVCLPALLSSLLFLKWLPHSSFRTFALTHLLAWNCISTGMYMTHFFNSLQYHHEYETIPDSLTYNCNSTLPSSFLNFITFFLFFSVGQIIPRSFIYLAKGMLLIKTA